MPRTLLAAVLLLATTPLCAADKPTPVVVDTDVGAVFDDALALALILSSPELDLRGVTTVHGDASTRALIVCRMLHAVGRAEVPVAAGATDRPDIGGAMQYGRRPAHKRPVKESAVEFLYQKLRASPGELTVIALGPLTSLAALFEKHPDCKPWVKKLVVMGGAVEVGYNGKPPAVAEWNFKQDPKAARAVLASGVPLVLVPLDVSATLRLSPRERDRVLRAGTPLTNQLRAQADIDPEVAESGLFDPLAVAVALDEKWCSYKDLRLEVDEKGLSRSVQGKANARVAMGLSRQDFQAWLTRRLAPKEAVPLPGLPETNRAKPVDRGSFPHRVHVFEDYETDIERRWWLAGKLEPADGEVGKGRHCRGALTNDFDDKQGNAKALYRAVIFNPVPGPPMGKQTRLAFRCKLAGTTRLRVQIYSLSNGYHRHLTLTGLEQGKWLDLAVDMTQCRRPDGTGGALSENERIDDIQFYTDPEAELAIDNIVLYDAAGEAEKRPFPAALHFTGWFDTGRQGQEWPGDFEIADKKGVFWKAARSVPHPDGGNWVRVDLRGGRPLGSQTRLTFRYNLTGADSLRVRLKVGEGKDAVYPQVSLTGLEKGLWGEGRADFGEVRRGLLREAREVQFLVPKGAELLIDDVLLYEPARK